MSNPSWLTLVKQYKLLTRINLEKENIRTVAISLENLPFKVENVELSFYTGYQFSKPPLNINRGADTIKFSFNMSEIEIEKEYSIKLLPNDKRVEFLVSEPIKGVKFSEKDSIYIKFNHFVHGIHEIAEELENLLISRSSSCTEILVVSGVVGVLMFLLILFLAFMFYKKSSAYDL